MSKFLFVLRLPLWQNGILYLILALLWSLVSVGLNHFENGQSYFDIIPLLQFKIVLTAVVFLGRQWLFKGYQLQAWNPWLFPVCLLSVGITVFNKIAGCSSLIYGLLILADILIWACLLSAVTDTIMKLFHFWSKIPKINYAIFSEFWTKLANDLLWLCFWLTLLTGLAFYYLVCFFLVDAVLYSFLLLFLVFLPGIALYLLVYLKINAWIRNDLTAIDGEITSYLDWRELKNDPDLAQKTAWFQYLSSLRIYLHSLQRPVFLFGPFLTYIVSSIFILGLPYVFGRAVEV